MQAINFQEKISEEIRNEIIHLHKEVESQRRITGVSKTGDQKMIKSYTENEKKKTDRPPKL